MKDRTFFALVIFLYIAFISCMAMISEFEKTKREIIKCQTDIEIKKIESGQSQVQVSLAL